MSGIKIMKAVWGKREGFVFIPHMTPEKKWKERCFRYPEELKSIETYVDTTGKSNNLYWCPLVFSKNKRLKEYALPETNVMWADLDFVDPTTLEDKPTIAWKSSDDRFQCLWCLDNDYDVFKVEDVNRAMTYKIGADKGGWDITQVLRVPGSSNFKYDPPQEGKLLWVDKAEVYNLDSLSLKLLDDVEAEEASTLDILMAGWKIKPRIRDLIKVHPSETEGEDRSAKLWEIECGLVESGLPTALIIQIVKECPWNKFKGRRDEKEQIMSEVMKAEVHVRSRDKEETTRELVETILDEEDFALPYMDFMSKSIEPPQWLIEGFWQAKTYGMIAGEPKTFKSVTATDMAFSVATGLPFLGLYNVPTPGRVLYIQEENSEATVQDRNFKIAYHKGLLGAPFPDDLGIYFMNNNGFDLTLKEDRVKIERNIEKIRPVLVILDPLYMMLGEVDENSATEVRNILKWITSLRNKYQTAIVICHHYNKAGSTADSKTRGGGRIRGTSQFHGWVESALYVKKPPMPGQIYIEKEFRSFPSTQDVSIHITIGEPGEPVYQPVVTTYSEEVEAMVEVEVDRLVAILKHEPPQTFNGLRTLTGLSHGEMTKMIRKMTDLGLLISETGTGHKLYKLDSTVKKVEATEEEIKDGVLFDV